MSQKRIKLFLAGIGLALAFASGANAQVSQMRLFSPYQDDQFGGGAYMNEGLYGSIGAGMINISLPNTYEVGHHYNDQADAPYLISRMTAGNYTAIKTGNQISTAQLHSEFTSATEFEIGEIEGHHGWSVKGTILTPQRLGYKGADASVNIYDPSTVLVSEYIPKGASSANYLVWYNDTFVPVGTDGASRMGHLWALIDLSGSQTTDQGYSENTLKTSNSANTGTGSNTGTNDGETSSMYAFAPIPIIYDYYSLNTTVNCWSVEAMYTYRFHPFRVGTLELLAGLRYTVFDDSMNFMGHATTRTESSYTQTLIDVLDQGGGTIGYSNGSNGTTKNEQVNETNEDYNGFSGADLGYSSWNFEADNQIIGPQVGGRFTLSNNRWRLIGEGTFFAGFNRQNVSGFGQMGLKYSPTQSGDNTQTGGIPLNCPINTVANAFNYSEHYNQFTPGANVKAEAVWYWTQAVSFKVGYEFTFLGDIARSFAVNDYRVNDNGTYFGVQEDKKYRNSDTYVHGVMFTAQINK